MEFDFKTFLHNYRQINNFMRENDIRHEINEPGTVTTRMTIAEKHLSSPGVAHGGSLAGLMDAVLGVAALSAALVEGNLVSTVEFKMNYFKPLFLGDELEGKGKIVRKGKTLIVTTAEIYRKDEMIAHGQGTFNIYPMSKRVKMKDVVDK